MQETNQHRDTLLVSEVYRTLQGEASAAGLPCVLIRLTGCNLDCSWCDTIHAREEAGQEMTIPQIMQTVAELGCPRVELTGGEPLLQPAAATLLDELCKAGYETLLETNGSVDISQLNPQIHRIVDIKCPDSGMDNRNLWSNLSCLTERDEVKFVIASRADFDYAVSITREHKLLDKCGVIFSPVWSAVTPADLAEWILAENIDVRLGLQMHKIIWPDIDRGV